MPLGKVEIPFKLDDCAVFDSRIYSSDVSLTELSYESKHESDSSNIEMTLLFNADELWLSIIMEPSVTRKTFEIIT